MRASWRASRAPEATSLDNITGASIGVGGSGLAGKWLELLKEAVPGVSRVAVLANSANPAGAASVREVEAASRPLKVKLDLHDAANAETLGSGSREDQRG